MRINEENKWIVTGAAGFLGSHVVEKLLAQDQEVLAVDNLSWGTRENISEFEKNSKFHLSIEDIRDTAKMKKLFDEFSPKYVLHLAALHFIPDAIKNPSEAVSINVHGTMSILEAARTASVQKLFFASTGDVYEPTEDEPHIEDGAKVPFNIYGMTKYLGEQLLQLESKDFPEKNFVIARIFNLIGTRETNPHILPVIFEQLHEHPGKLSLGNIHPLRDLVPITDAAQAAIEMVYKADFSIDAFNLATGNSTSIANVIDLMGDILGEKIEVSKDPARVRKVERNVLSCDVSKLKNYLGWTPSADLRNELTMLLKHEGLLK